MEFSGEGIWTPIQNRSSPPDVSISLRGGGGFWTQITLFSTAPFLHWPARLTCPPHLYFGVNTKVSARNFSCYFKPPYHRYFCTDINERNILMCRFQVLSTSCTYYYASWPTFQWGQGVHVTYLIRLGTTFDLMDKGLPCFIRLGGYHVSFNMGEWGYRASSSRTGQKSRKK